MSGGSAGRERVARTLGRRGFFAALIAAACLYAVLLVQAVLLTLLGAVGLIRYLGASGDSGSAGSTLGSLVGGFIGDSLITALPFAIGVFVGLWQILPIAPELRFAHVVARSIAAAAIGWIAAVVVSAVTGAIASFSTAMLLGDQLEFLRRTANGIGGALLDGLLSGTRVFVVDLPLTVLTGLLLWGFLQRFPPRHGVAGVVDEL